MTPPVIDLHNHIATPACQTLVEGLGSPLDDPFAFYSGEETKAYNAAHFAALVPKLTHPARRLEDMEKMGVDLQVLSVAPPQYYYWTDPALGQRLARLQNEHLASLVAAHPDRFAGLATVPLQDVDLAVAELDFAVGEFGLRGVEICTNVNGLDLDDRRMGFEDPVGLIESTPTLSADDRRMILGGTAAALLGLDA